MLEVLRLTPTGRTLAPRLATARLFAPELLDVEIASALRRSYLYRGEGMTRIVSALGALEDWPIERIPHKSLVAPSVRWWSNVTAYDAMYLAVAVQHEATIVTVDGALARAPIADVVVESVRVTG